MTYHCRYRAIETQICLSVVSPTTHDFGEWRFSRLASCGKPNHDDGDTTRVKQTARHGAVQLGRRHIAVRCHIVNAVYEGAALSPVPRGVCRDFCGTKISISIVAPSADISKVNLAMQIRVRVPRAVAF